MRIRFWVFGTITAVPAPVFAASIDPMGDDIQTRPDVRLDLIPISSDELLDVLNRHYINLNDGAVTPSVLLALAQIVLLCAALAAVLRILPRDPPYPVALAWLARSRTRWIMARKPFDRCADK